MTVDSGNAPCVFTKDDSYSDVLTLACCKGGLRGVRRTIGINHKDKIESGEREVFLFGIYNKNYLLYIAKVTEVLKYAEYFSNHSKYKKQRDQIYNYRDGECHRNNTNKLFHPKEMKDLHIVDESGEYVLASNSFAYFGKDCKRIDASLISELHKGIGHKPYYDCDDIYNNIVKYIKTVWDFNTIIVCEPNDPLKNENDRGCKQK